MAKDVTNKTASSTTNNSPPISDQQKVPPLRIVLNTSGNQKSSSTAVAATTNQQQQVAQDIKREKTQDARADGALKTGGRVRIKLGTNKKQVSKSSTSDSSSDKTLTDDGTKSKNAVAERQDNLLKEEINANYSHLRRITRRSQRSVQTVNNEDEESISSMTSTDENQNTTNNNNSDNNSGQDTTAAASTQSNASSSLQTGSSTSNSSSTNTAETPRRYKRRKGETSESQLTEQDALFGFQNYKLPVQNSFELYKNIRKQVDKKLNSLNKVHPKTPYGFRDYMLARGAYLLDGNKLGNGTNLFMNEDGGLHPAPISKYHSMRYSKINYSVPNRAKVPLGLPVNSPLYNLFIDQEKDRYKMRMQHIKEREKLTLASEQEVVRVYNQAAMAAANQIEPFSACTMLKHQEIYNYIDSDGVTIQSSEDDQLDQADQVKQEGVRTRRRQHEQISPAPTRKNSNQDTECPDVAQKDTVKSPNQTTSLDEAPKEITEQSKESPIEDTTKEEKTVDEANKESNNPPKESDERVVVKDECDKQDDKSASSESEDNKTNKNESESTPANENTRSESSSKPNDTEKNQVAGDIDSEDKHGAKPLSDAEVELQTEPMDTSGASDNKELECSTKPSLKNLDGDGGQQSNEKNKGTREQDQPEIHKPDESTANDTATAEDSGQAVVCMDQDASTVPAPEPELILTDDARRAYNKDIFLTQLQDIDDKWDKIRNEMFIRHRNEAESLYAVQRLEWEWKTKEIGACDIRTTPIIDNTLVPKLNIYSQDY